MAAFVAAEAFDLIDRGVPVEIFVRVRVRDAVVEAIRRNVNRVERLRNAQCAAALCSEFARDRQYVGTHNQTVEDRVIEFIDLQELAARLESLPDRERAALKLTFLADLSVDEVARRLGVRRETVWRWATRGISRLRRQVRSG